MQIHRIRYIGVGPFTDDVFQFDAPGLNVIAGDNETGKSTLCRAMSAVLYGFPDKPTSEAFRSWRPADQYSGEVEITGKRARYRVERNFATDRVRVVKILPRSEEEVFNGDGNPRGRTEPALAYKKLLTDEIGLPSESVFNSSARVGQLQLEIAIDEDLRKQLSGAGQADYKRARESLRDQYYELTARPIGRDASKRKERKVENMRSALTSLISALSKACNDRTAMAALLEQKSTLETELSAMQEEHGLMQKRLEAMQAHDLLARRLKIANTQMSQAASNDEASAKLDEQIASIEQEIAEKRFSVLRGLTELDLENLRRYLNSDADNALAEIKTLTERETQLQCELRERTGALCEAPAHTGEILESINAHRETIARLEREIAEAPEVRAVGPNWRLPLIGLAAGALLGALFGFLVGMASGGNAALIMCILSFGGAVLGGALGFVIYSTQIGGLTSARALRSAKQDRLTQEQNGLAEARARLAPQVAAIEPEQSMSDLLELWRFVETTQRELRDLANQRAVHESLSALVFCNDPVIGPIIQSQPFQELRKRLEQFDELSACLTAHKLTRTSLHAIACPSDSERQSHSAERNGILEDLLFWEDQYPTFRPLRDDDESRLAHLEQDKQAVARASAAQKAFHQRIQSLEINIARAEGNLEHDPVAFQEEIDQRQEELNQMTMRCGALQTAVEVLEQAITDYERDHLKRLSQRTAQYFSQFTGGRYEAVNISPNQPITVTPTAGTAFASTSLSTGARDQLYFAVRLAISDLLADEVKLPLILDDTFVNFDRKRLAIAREMLTQIAATRQIVLLSHDTTYTDWATRVIELGETASIPVAI
jgi:uncharacterized protein YhaN